jgi:hypothetical protein
MKIVIPGGSGQVGTVLARAFHGDGHHVVVLSRRPRVEPWRVVEWDGQTLGGWRSEIDGSDVVINLAGRSVNCRYNAANRAEILESRVLSTPCCRTGQRSVGPCSARIAPGEHGDDLRASYDGPNGETSGLLRGYAASVNNRAPTHGQRMARQPKLEGCRGSACAARPLRRTTSACIQERRLVDQNIASWNRFVSWLQRLEGLQRTG